uniref:RING-type domain-containing protein n=1 Tax=Magallana gigas TaxID=29159 RepID=A0A8W8N168_MAGGI
MTFDILTSFYSIVVMLVESKMSIYLALIAMTLNVIQLCLWLRLQKSQKPEREPLETRDQEVSTSTCCGAGVLQLLLSHFSPTEPPPEINMEEEMKQPYMKAFRRLYEENEYPQEKVVAAIKYMNTRRGGIQAHRNSDSLVCALEHIKSMELRMDDSGFFEDYTLEDLQQILVETNEYPIEDFNQLMTSDLGHSTSLYPVLMESLFMSSSLAVILIDWNHSFLERSLLRLILSYLPRWRYRNIRQDVYICLVIVALAIIYHSSMKNLTISPEICRMTAVTIVILLSFWLQSKTREENVSDKCIGTSKIKVSNKSVQGESLVTRDQEDSVSTCCEAGIPQSLLSLLPSSSEPQSEVDVEEEMRQSYVKDFREQFDEEIVPEEKLVTAIKYLNTRRGGIAAHRDFDKLMHAVDHIDKFTLSSRLDDSGFPQDYSYDELRHIMVKEKKYRPEEFRRVLEICLETSGFLPSPEEFEEIRNETKGIVELEEEVEEANQALERSMRVVEETTQEVVESRQKYRSLKQRLQQRDQALQQHQQALQQRDQTIQQRDQALQQKEQALQQKEQALQQKDRMLEQKDRIIQQERQRVREMEQNPEGEFQRRLREMEEEIRRLSAKSNRAVCKICRVEEVQVVFSPCNHSVSCEGCVPSLKEKCPMCRETIQGTVEMILA